MGGNELKENRQLEMCLESQERQNNAIPPTLTPAHTQNQCLLIQTLGNLPEVVLIHPFPFPISTLNKKNNPSLKKIKQNSVLNNIPMRPTCFTLIFGPKVIKFSVLVKLGWNNEIIQSSTEPMGHTAGWPASSQI